MPYHVKTPKALGTGDVYWKENNTWTDVYADRKQYSTKSAADAVKATTETRVTVTDSSSLAVNSRIVVGSEIMKITQVVDAITVIVKRGFDSSIATEHISGTTINLLTTADDAQIESGDDFGFNEFNEFFDDGFTYSPTKKTDV